MQTLLQQLFAQCLLGSGFGRVGCVHNLHAFFCDSDICCWRLVDQHRAPGPGGPPWAPPILPAPTRFFWTWPRPASSATAANCSPAPAGTRPSWNPGRVLGTLSARLGRSQRDRDPGLRPMAAPTRKTACVPNGCCNWAATATGAPSTANTPLGRMGDDRSFAATPCWRNT